MKVIMDESRWHGFCIVQRRSTAMPTASGSATDGGFAVRGKRACSCPVTHGIDCVWTSSGTDDWSHHGKGMSGWTSGRLVQLPESIHPGSAVGAALARYGPECDGDLCCDARLAQGTLCIGAWTSISSYKQEMFFYLQQRWKDLFHVEFM